MAVKTPAKPAAKAKVNVKPKVPPRPVVSRNIDIARKAAPAKAASKGRPPASVRPGGSQGKLTVRQRALPTKTIPYEQAMAQRKAKQNKSIVDQLLGGLGDRFREMTSPGQRSVGVGTGSPKMVNW